jgi:rhodanese-related sulfurtransferase
MPKTVDQLVDEAKRRIRSATPDEVADLVLSGELVVVDVREPDEFEKGSIPGAVNIPRGWLEFKADPTCPAYDERISPDKPLLVTCAIGGRSALAVAALHELDYANVTNLEDGFEAWKNAGYPIARPEAAPVG